MNQSVTMIASARQIYNGVGIVANQEFEATSEAEADDLVAVQMARRKAPKRKPEAAKPEVKQPEPVKDEITTRDVVADESTPGDEPAAVDAASVRSTYNRRDMRARRS